MRLQRWARCGLEVCGACSSEVGQRRRTGDAHHRKRRGRVWGSLRSPQKLSCGPQASENPVAAPLSVTCVVTAARPRVLPSSAIPSGGQGAQRRGQARPPPQTRPVALPLLSPRLSQESQSRGPAGALTRESARSLLCTEVWGAGASDSRSVRALRLHRIKNKLRRVDSRLGTSEWPHFLFPRFE